MQQDRYARFMEKAQDISHRRLTAKVGRRLRVLVDEIDTDEGVAIARGPGDAPEIDGQVFIEGAGASALKPGDWADVTITDASEYDLYAEL